MLAGKVITIGVSGGIAAYKAAWLVSNLAGQGAEVHVMMTRSAQEFVNPLTFQALSGHPVRTGLFTAGKDAPIPHVELAVRSDLLVIVPATANIIGKVAGGIADDLLSTTIMSATCPVLFCPAMNVNMYQNPVVQRNLVMLRELGYHLLEPGVGRLACGTEGRGRLPEPEIILEQIRDILGRAGDLNGMTVLVTAGPTRELLDPVRYITNRSSGKMGYAVAGAASRRGAGVILVSGAVGLEPPPGVKLVPVETARQMFDVVMEHFPAVDVVVKSAAVADYRPRETAVQKIKKNADNLILELEKNPDILFELGRRKERQLLVGFAAETGKVEENALAKVRQKNLDLLVANDVTLPGAGFGADTNIATLVYPDGTVIPLPKMEKLSLAHRILDEVLALRRARGF
ncbi:MAG: bifunctional phosphopantothenoylcysteine decarboxylase/phosphopantothenate--cysteine ligase CoaBC [Peptococcaceae bacterium]|nr:MAG: bifunctional phosphopantothenoylcysteine decarboxylase/phosphopantothenate--cysteine ligase CoaBC [Peptococcaceae bacterium]